MGKHKGVSSKTHTQKQCDHYSNQNNKNNNAHKVRLDNHSNQRNPNHKEAKVKLSKSEFQPDMWPGFIDN